MKFGNWEAVKNGHHLFSGRQLNQMNPFDLEKGAILDGRYRIGAKIATGSMAVVYEGTQIKLDRPVAIKFLHPSYCNSEQFLKRFELEIKAMSQLSHPNCVSVIDFGITNPTYLVMEYIHGQTLTQIMKSGPMEPSRALLIIRDILAGLSHTHKHGILHRDIKPSNVMITQAECAGDHVRILDFGLAKHFRERGDTLTETGQFAGTLYYLAPESMREDTTERNLDERTDLFSVGVVAYKLLTGVKPYTAKNPSDVFEMYNRTPLTLALAYPEGNFSSGLENMIAKAISANPEDRYQDAEAFVAALDSVSQTANSKNLLVRLGPLKKEVRKLYNRMPALPALVKERFRDPKWRNTMLLITIIVLQLVSLVKSSQNVCNIHESSRNPQMQHASFNVNSSTSNQERLNAVRKPSRAKIHDETRVMEFDKKRRQDTPTEEKIAKQVKTHVDKPPEDNETQFIRRKTSEVQRLVKRGRTTAAIRKLKKLEAKFPKNGYIQLYQGNLYSRKRIYDKALAAYERAIELKDNYRHNKFLIKNTVRALGSKRSHKKATSLIEEKIGMAARPQLRKAGSNAYGRLARIRAVRILEKWNKQDAKPDRNRESPIPEPSRS